MPFSQQIYGAQAATALNALADPIQGSGFVTSMFSEAEGTPFEADLLLGCSGLCNSPVYRLMRPSSPTDVFVPSDCYRLVEKFIGKKPSTRPEVLDLVRQLRRSIPRLVSGTRSGPAFSNAKFGPRVARLLNALLALEIAVVGNTGVDKQTDVFRITYPQAQAFGPWVE